MADLSVNFAGIKSPNPFWLASGPPTNTYVQVAKAFDAGWGGAVWKTIGEPIINVFSRYGSIDLGKTRMVGFNNIELISDRPVEDNLKELKLAKKNYPKNVVVASLMVESKREAWHERTRHGRCRRASPRLHVPDRRMGEGSLDDPRDCEVDAQRHRHHVHRARGGEGRRGRTFIDQHDQLDRRPRPEFVRAASER